jgi:hypothetical protein
MRSAKVLVLFFKAKLKLLVANGADEVDFFIFAASLAVVRLRVQRTDTVLFQNHTNKV